MTGNTTKMPELAPTLEEALERYVRLQASEVGLAADDLELLNGSLGRAFAVGVLWQVETTWSLLQGALQENLSADEVVGRLLRALTTHRFQARETESRMH